jgi:hypothetical protein
MPWYRSSNRRAGLNLNIPVNTRECFRSTDFWTTVYFDKELCGGAFLEKDDSYVAGREIPSTPWNPKIQYSIDNLSADHMLSQLNVPRQNLRPFRFFDQHISNLSHPYVICP